MRKRMIYRTLPAIAAFTLAALMAFTPADAASRRGIDLRQGRGAIAEPQPQSRTVPERNPLLGVVVSDIDPLALLRGDRATVHPMWSGPFRGHDTLGLFIVGIFDRRLAGEEPLDMVVRFTLPDGSLYQEMIRPIDPSAAPGATTRRQDLAPDAVPLLSLRAVGPLARWLPGGAVDPAQLRGAGFASVMLPVSGTWITRHNLYGDWRVDVIARRDGRELGRSSAEFYIGL